MEECFDFKLLLRQKHHRHDQAYPQDLFDHLGLCRSCWAYAHYLWHKEAEQSSQSALLSEEEVEARLDQAWALKSKKAS